MRAALSQHQRVIRARDEEGTSAITLCFEINALEKREAWRAVENERTGAYFASFSEYCAVVLPQFSPAQVSKRLAVARFFEAKEFDEADLAVAGYDKLYYAIKLVEAGLISGEHVVKIAQERSKSDLMAIKNGEVDKDDTLSSYLTASRVPRAFSARFAAQLERRRVMLEARESGQRVTEIAAIEFMLNNLAAESDEYLAQAADGYGGQPIVKLNIDLQSSPPVEAFRELFAQLRSLNQNPKELAEIAAQVAVEEHEYYEAEERARKAHQRIEEKSQRLFLKRAKAIKPGSILNWENGVTAVVTDNMVNVTDPPTLWITATELPEKLEGIELLIGEAVKVPVQNLAANPPATVTAPVKSAKPKVAKPKAAKPAGGSPLSKAAQAARGKGGKKAASKKGALKRR
jgi:hypothetical protein